MRRLERVAKWRADRQATARRLLDGERRRWILLDPATLTDGEIAAVDSLLVEAGMSWEDFERTFQPFTDAARFRSEIRRLESQDVATKLEALEREREALHRQMELFVQGSAGHHDCRIPELQERIRVIGCEVAQLRTVEKQLKDKRAQLESLERSNPEVAEALA